MNLQKYGFTDRNVDNTPRSGTIKHITGSIFALNGYSLITKVDIEDLRFIQDDKRIIIYDSDNEIIMDAALNDICEWKVKKCGNDMEEHVFRIKRKGIYCKMLVSGYEETYK